GFWACGSRAWRCCVLQISIWTRRLPSRRAIRRSGCSQRTPRQLRRICSDGRVSELICLEYEAFFLHACVMARYARPGTCARTGLSCPWLSMAANLTLTLCGAWCDAYRTQIYHCSGPGTTFRSCGRGLLCEPANLVGCHQKARG